MEAYLLDWVNLLVRWAHVIVGVAWIGASFYFIWLDDHLEPSRDPRLAGELWAIHGGGFYRAEKHKLGPEQLPATASPFGSDIAIAGRYSEAGRSIASPG